MNRFKTARTLSVLISMMLVTMLIGLIYVSVQQDFRSTANDPQVQMAYDVKAHLEHGKQLEFVLPPDSVDIETSLAPFLVMYDNEGKPLRASGFLKGRMPELPSGIFDFVKVHGEDRVTWQPNPRVRMAMIIVRSSASPVGFIAAGRSLNEIENREANLRRMVLICWLLSMVLVFAGKRVAIISIP